LFDDSLNGLRLGLTDAAGITDWRKSLMGRGIMDRAKV
jgi:hypothetical protein